MPILSWEDASGSEDAIVNIESGLSYDMGGMTANVSFLDQSDDGSATAYTADDPLYTGAEGFDLDSSLKLLGTGGDGSAADETMTATIDFSANDGSGFSDNVSDVAFRINDLDLGTDNTDIVTILAYDAAGNLVPVTLTPTSTMTQAGSTVTGNDTEYYPDEEEASLLVEIEGPVSRIVIQYANGDMGEQRVHVTDVHYSTIEETDTENGPVDGTEGDDVMLVGFVDTDGDTIDGADGDDDTILGYEGDDTIDGGAGVDTIYGGDDADTILLQDGEFDGDIIEGGEGGDDLDTLDTTGVPEDVTVTFDGNEDGDVVGETSGDVAEFSEIEAIITGGGDDTVDGSVTDGGIDVTTGGGSDSVDGGDGDDVIDTSGPSDAIDHVVDFPTPFDILDQVGDPDPTDDMDVVDGGDGNDTITTGDDADTVYGGIGDDTIDSGIDDDLVEGGAGDDSIDAGLGADEVYGGDGDDFINAGIDAFTDYADDDPLFPFVDPNPNDGMDTVYGGDGNDTILTGDDADTIFGDEGNDTIDAGIDDDYIEGGAGDDSIDGGHGSDVIFGGEGNDTINAAENFGAVPLGIGEVVDALDPEPTNGLDTVYGDEGDDTIYGGDDADVLFGGDDNDELYGGIDNDELFGGDGSDTLDGGTGADVLDGGADDDDLTVGAGDTATGGFGDDVFFIDESDLDGSTITIDGSDGGEGDPEDTTNDNYPGAPLPIGDVLDLTNLFTSGLADETSVTYTSADEEDGFVTLTDGTVINFEEIENIICFTRGTMIVTDKG